VTRAHLHGVTILADATMAMVTFPRGRPRRFFIRTTDELGMALDAAEGSLDSAEKIVEVEEAIEDAWESHIEEAWAALEARTAEVP